MNKGKKLLSMLTAAMFALGIMTALSFPSQAAMLTDNKEAKVISATESSTAVTLNWNPGYIAVPGKNGIRAYELKNASGCYYTDVFIVEKAGTEITYTDPSSNFLTNAGYSVSSWKKDTNGYWVGDPDGANYYAMAQYSSRVQAPNSNGGIDYRYVTSVDNEAIRLAIRVNNESELPQVSFRKTGEKGTYRQELDDERSAVTYNADGTVSGIFWTCGYIGSSTNTNGYPGEINPSSANFAYSGVINLGKAGTVISFTAPKVSNYAAANAYVVSHWELKEGANRYTHVKEGVTECPGNGGVDRVIRSGNVEVFTEVKNADGSVTYTYMSTKDEEKIRLCYYTACSFNEVPKTPPTVRWSKDTSIDSGNIFDAETEFLRKTYQFGTELTLNYRIYIPDDYDASKTYPLILFLHGSGERGSDNAAQLKNGILVPFADPKNPIHNCIVVAPQCPSKQKWVSVSSWSDAIYSTESIPESLPLKATYALLESLKTEYSVDTDRIYATGISMGGYGTWDLLVRHNDFFAAAIPVCGGCDVNFAEKLVFVPIRTFHGTADNTVPMKGTSAMYERITELGGKKMTFTKYEGQGHSIWNKAFAEEGLFEWLLSQKLSDRANEQLQTTSDTESVTDEPTGEASSTHESETTAKPGEPDKGCGSSAAYSAAVLAALCGIAMVCKKKKHS